MASLDTLRQYRVALAPLRFGAGLKGKVVDSWAHGLPVCILDSNTAHYEHIAVPVPTQRPLTSIAVIMECWDEYNILSDGVWQVVTTAIGSEGMRIEDYHAADSKVGIFKQPLHQ